jgi:hypothetical protein
MSTYACPKSCGRSFKKKFNAERHATTCQPHKGDYSDSLLVATKGVFICNKCEKEYTTKRAFKAHISKGRCHPPTQLEAAPAAITQPTPLPPPTQPLYPEKTVPKLISFNDYEGVFYDELYSDALLVTADTALIMTSLKEIKLSIQALREEVTQGKKFKKLPPRLDNIQRSIYGKLSSEVREPMRSKIADFLARVANTRTRDNYMSILSGFAKQGPDPTLEGLSAYFDQKNFAAMTAKLHKTVILRFLAGEYGWTNEGINIRLDKFRPPPPIIVPSRDTIGKIMQRAISDRNPDFATFVWFAYAVGQRLGDLLNIKAANLTPKDNGSYLACVIAGKTQKFIHKYVPAGLAKRLDLTVQGPMFTWTKKYIRKTLKEYSFDIGQEQIRPKNLRAAHISSIAEILKVGMAAGSHSSTVITQVSYLAPSVLNVFNMDEYCIESKREKPKKRKAKARGN